MALNLKGQSEIAETSVYIKTTANGETVVADITRIWTAKGYGWQAMATAAVAALVVRPTTVAMATLYNNTSNNFVIERAFAHNLVAVANSSYGIWLCVHPIGMTAPTNDITVRNSLSGKTTGSSGIFDNGATVLDDGWFPWGGADKVVTVTVPGGQQVAEIAGRIIIPPTAALSLQIVGSTTSVTCTTGFMWYSVPTTQFAVSQ